MKLSRNKIAKLLKIGNQSRKNRSQTLNALNSDELILGTGTGNSKSKGTGNIKRRARTAYKQDKHINMRLKTLKGHMRHGQGHGQGHGQVQGQGQGQVGGLLVSEIVAILDTLQLDATSQNNLMDKIKKASGLNDTNDKDYSIRNITENQFNDAIIDYNKNTKNKVTITPTIINAIKVAAEEKKNAKKGRDDNNYPLEKILESVNDSSGNVIKLDPPVSGMGNVSPIKTLERRNAVKYRNAIPSNAPLDNALPLPSNALPLPSNDPIQTVSSTAVKKTFTIYIDGNSQLVVDESSTLQTIFKDLKKSSILNEQTDKVYYAKHSDKIFSDLGIKDGDKFTTIDNPEYLFFYRLLYGDLFYLIDLQYIRNIVSYLAWNDPSNTTNPKLNRLIKMKIMPPAPGKSGDNDVWNAVDGGASIVDGGASDMDGGGQWSTGYFFKSKVESEADTAYVGFPIPDLVPIKEPSMAKFKEALSGENDKFFDYLEESDHSASKSGGDGNIISKLKKDIKGNKEKGENTDEKFGILKETDKIIQNTTLTNIKQLVTENSVNWKPDSSETLLLKKATVENFRRVLKQMIIRRLKDMQTMKENGEAEEEELTIEEDAKIKENNGGILALIKDKLNIIDNMKEKKKGKEEEEKKLAEEEKKLAEEKEKLQIEWLKATNENLRNQLNKEIKTVEYQLAIINNINMNNTEKNVTNTEIYRKLNEEVKKLQEQLEKQNYNEQEKLDLNAYRTKEANDNQIILQQKQTENINNPKKFKLKQEIEEKKKDIEKINKKYEKTNQPTIQFNQDGAIVNSTDFEYIDDDDVNIVTQYNILQSQLKNLIASQKPSEGGGSSYSEKKNQIKELQTIYDKIGEPHLNIKQNYDKESIGISEALNVRKVYLVTQKMENIFNNEVVKNASASDGTRVMPIDLKTARIDARELLKVVVIGGTELENNMTEILQMKYFLNYIAFTYLNGNASSPMTGYFETSNILQKINAYYDKISLGDFSQSFKSSASDTYTHRFLSKLRFTSKIKELSPNADPNALAEYKANLTGIIKKFSENHFQLYKTGAGKDALEVTKNKLFYDLNGIVHHGNFLKLYVKKIEQYCSKLRYREIVDTSIVRAGVRQRFSFNLIDDATIKVTDVSKTYSLLISLYESYQSTLGSADLDTTYTGLRDKKGLSYKKGNNEQNTDVILFAFLDNNSNLDTIKNIIASCTQNVVDIARSYKEAVKFSIKAPNEADERNKKNQKEKESAMKILQYAKDIQEIVTTLPEATAAVPVAAPAPANNAPAPVNNAPVNNLSNALESVVGGGGAMTGGDGEEIAEIRNNVGLITDELVKIELNDFKKTVAIREVKKYNNQIGSEVKKTDYNKNLLTKSADSLVTAAGTLSKLIGEAQINPEKKDNKGVERKDENKGTSTDKLAELAQLKIDVEALKGKVLEYEDKKNKDENLAAIQAIMGEDNAFNHKIKFLVDIPKWQQFKVIGDMGTNVEGAVRGVSNAINLQSATNDTAEVARLVAEETNTKNELFTFYNDNKTVLSGSDDKKKAASKAKLKILYDAYKDAQKNETKIKEIREHLENTSANATPENVTPDAGIEKEIDALSGAVALINDRDENKGKANDIDKEALKKQITALNTRFAAYLEKESATGKKDDERDKTTNKNKKKKETAIANATSLIEGAKGEVGAAANTVAGVNAVGNAAVIKEGVAKPGEANIAAAPVLNTVASNIPVKELVAAPVVNTAAQVSNAEAASSAPAKLGEEANTEAAKAEAAKAEEAANAAKLKTSGGKKMKSSRIKMRGGLPPNDTNNELALAEIKAILETGTETGTATGTTATGTTATGATPVVEPPPAGATPTPAKTAAPAEVRATGATAAVGATGATGATAKEAPETGATGAPVTEGTKEGAAKEGAVETTEGATGATEAAKTPSSSGGKSKSRKRKTTRKRKSRRKSKSSRTKK